MEEGKGRGVEEGWQDRWIDRWGKVDQDITLHEIFKWKFQELIIDSFLEFRIENFIENF